MERYDVVVVGGGPAGLSAALTLGRAVKKVLVADAGVPRNARAKGVNGFLTRDGIAPRELREVSREELGRYGVEVVPRWVGAIEGERDRFEVVLDDRRVACRRVVLSMGMVDGELELPGFRETWGHGVFQCPFCHGWELRARPWGVLATSLEAVSAAPMFSGWATSVTVFTGGGAAGFVEVSGELEAQLAASGIAFERAPIAALAHEDGVLRGVRLEGGALRSCEALIARLPQRQTALVGALGLALDAHGFVVVDPRMATSRTGIYAAGDLCTGMQSAIGGAAAGQKAGAMVVHDLNTSSATSKG